LKRRCADNHIRRAAAEGGAGWEQEGREAPHPAGFAIENLFNLEAAFRALWAAAPAAPERCLAADAAALQAAAAG
jgi:hypothetical protein